MKTIFKVLVFVLAVASLGALAIFFAPGKNVPVVEVPDQEENNREQLLLDEEYCNQYDPQDCPQKCVVCPPCEVCSSIQCRAAESCAAMGFDKNWYKENATPVETRPVPDGGGGQAPNAGMANPASVYCVDQGGRLEVREGEGGQFGICVLSDGRQCEEWEFFRTKACGAAGADDSGADNQACGIENCHGMDIKCGPNPAQMCTMEYRLGDKCRQYAKCDIVNGKCQQISNAAFDACKACVQKCEADFANDPMKAFDCESNCE